MLTFLVIIHFIVLHIPHAGWQRQIKERVCACLHACICVHACYWCMCCLCACTHACVGCVRACVSACVHACMRACVRLRVLCVCSCTYVCACIHTCTPHACTSARVHACTYAFVHTFMHVYMCTTCVHVQMPMRMSVWWFACAGYPMPKLELCVPLLCGFHVRDKERPERPFANKILECRQASTICILGRYSLIISFQGLVVSALQMSALFFADNTYGNAQPVCALTGTVSSDCKKLSFHILARLFRLSACLHVCMHAHRRTHIWPVVSRRSWRFQRLSCAG